MADTFRLRLRSVRFKDGRAPLRVIYPQGDIWKKAFQKDADSIWAHHPQPVGFALVIWDFDGSSSATCVVADASRMPTILVPSFVKDRLLAQRIERWTLDDLAQQ